MQKYPINYNRIFDAQGNPTTLPRLVSSQPEVAIYVIPTSWPVTFVLPVDLENPQQHIDSLIPALAAYSNEYTALQSYDQAQKVDLENLTLWSDEGSTKPERYYRTIINEETYFMLHPVFKDTYKDDDMFYALGAAGLHFRSPESSLVSDMWAEYDEVKRGDRTVLKYTMIAA